MSANDNLWFTFHFLILLPVLPALPVVPPDPDPSSGVQPFLPAPSPPATIPAFPEQSDVAGCPLDLPGDLFHSVKSACSDKKSTSVRRTRCCPVLAAWLYSAYSATALGSAGRAITAVRGGGATPQTTTSSYELPVLPDDSETCVDSLQMAMREKGIELVRPNETCDVVSCYCGIRLHPLNCPEAFSVNSKGNLVGNRNVKRLERDCLSSNNGGSNGLAGLGGCSKCLNTLTLLHQKNTGNESKSVERTSKIRNKDCELMGLTWLLAKNRSAYMHTVSAVLRALMMSTDGSDPQSCSLNSDGMPLAVDSSEIGDSSSSNILQSSLYPCILSLCLVYVTVSVSFRQLLRNI